MLLPQAQTLLGPDVTVTTVDQYDPTKTDGTIVAQNPLAGSTPGGSVQLTVARSAVISYLNDLNPVAGHWSQTTSIAISGKTYAHSASSQVCDYSSEEPGTVEYNLGRNYRTFKATAGISDDAANSSATVLLEVFADGRRVYSGTITYGQAFTVTADMTDVLRMKIQWQPSNCTREGSADLALGEARIEGLPGQVPIATPTP